MSIFSVYILARVTVAGGCVMVVHQPVLLEETVEGLAVRADGIYVDATLGSGGHAEAVLECLDSGILYGIDRDEEALDRCKRRLNRFGERFRPLLANYAQMGQLLAGAGVTEVDGILMDLGVSSEQLDTVERGFSFQTDGPLDMRMDRRQSLTAEQVVNGYPEDALLLLLREFGEERDAVRVARSIVSRRRECAFERTGDLADWIMKIKGGRRGHQHPATKSFQAIRMEVNGELEGIAQGLAEALVLLKSSGRLAVISFHSLEDRLVKHFFREHEGRWESLAAGGECWQGSLPAVRGLARKPVKPSLLECEENPRARSAKLRVVERVPHPGVRGER